ncbi:uncharacterized protein RAG0_04979 [Rhynchosporium agropyri]|uniref:Uncharacterized protein n=3 Tax=Rhynchosporium TaxID=38037 RepID=A0A1E1M087_RHYSE|nr:uncharacterized protein RAG0_04979 [Rhynchosporium agropyri]CZT01690.1 uncharacterized protein RCO7_14037 [Rhynchosporium commune]CZT42524.1 uncharacterized protein RSE6_02444 [Rhynchosporium secalis]
MAILPPTSHLLDKRKPSDPQSSENIDIFVR